MLEVTKLLVTYLCRNPCKSDARNPVHRLGLVTSLVAGKTALERGEITEKVCFI